MKIFVYALKIKQKKVKYVFVSQQRFSPSGQRVKNTPTSPLPKSKTDPAKRVSSV